MSRSGFQQRLGRGGMTKTGYSTSHSGRMICIEPIKLRIRENVIRLRLKRSEVDQIASGQSIVEKTHFRSCRHESAAEIADRRLSP